MDIKLKGPLPESLYTIGLRPGMIIKDVEPSKTFVDGYMSCKTIIEDEPYCFLVKPENYSKL
jgi:hypothetical protein